MYFVSANCLDQVEHISFISGVVWGILAFRPIHFGNIWWSRKGPSFWFWLVESTTLQMLMVGLWCLLAWFLWIRQEFFLLPPPSFQPLTFWHVAYLLCLWQLPRRKSINLDVEIWNLAATSRTVFSL